MGPSDSGTMTRGGPPTAEPEGPPGDWTATDRALIDEALASLLAENRSRAARLDAVSMFHAARVAEAESGGREGPGYFLLTPLESTKAEFGPLLVMSELFIENDLHLTDDLKRWFPRMWSHCLSGRLDIARARLAQAQLVNLSSEEDKAAYALGVEEYLDRQDHPGSVIHPVGYTNLQRAVRRICRRFPQKTKQESFSEAFARRRVRLRTDDENGMAALTCCTSVTDALRADYRLTLIAKKRAEVEGEERTIEQLRVDTLVELLMGRLTVGASDPDLEDDGGSEGSDPAGSFGWHDVGKFARPVINVTVPITTLMGLADTAGRLAGGVMVPAELARQIALDTASTWYRMLTDPHGGFLDLSTERYQPTEQIWAHTVARDPECVWPTCRKPATTVDLDHRKPYPLGETSTWNIQPLCERHHRVKHSQGFHVDREADGSYTWTSRFGSTFRKPPTEHPVGAWPRDSVLEERFGDLIAAAA